MAKFSIELNDEVSKELKVRIIQKYGSLRGYVDGVFEEAILLWLSNENKNNKEEAKTK